MNDAPPEATTEYSRGYQASGAFSGPLERVVIELGPALEPSPAPAS